MKEIIVDRGKVVASKDFALGTYPYGSPKFEASLALGIMKHMGSLAGARKRMLTPYSGPGLSVLQSILLINF